MAISTQKKTDRYSFLQILKSEYLQNSNIQVNGNQNYEYYSDGRLIQYGVYIPYQVTNTQDAIAETGMYNTDIYFRFPITFSKLDFFIAYPILTHRKSTGVDARQFHQQVLPGVICGNQLNTNSNQLIAIARKQSLTIEKENIYVACYAVGHV